MREPLSADWQTWLDLNVSRGCSHKSILDSLIEGGIAPVDASRYLLEKLDPDYSPIGTAKQNIDSFVTSRLENCNTQEVGGHSIRTLIRLKRPDLAVFNNLLTLGECSALINMSREKLKKSTVVESKTGASKEDHVRTSFGTFFQRQESEFISALEARIAQLVNWPVEHGEGLQILRYLPGEEYRPHFDYFPLRDEGSSTHLVNGGQRVATLILYLNDVELGGATSFPNVGLTVKPQTGNAVYFAYTTETGETDPLSLHAGEPVLKGEKWIATKWLRERPF